MKDSSGKIDIHNGKRRLQLKLANVTDDALEALRDVFESVNSQRAL